MPRQILVLLCALAIGGCASPPLVPTPATDDMPIGAVQGHGPSSPLEGEIVAISGVVTSLLDDGRSGWFVQDGGDGDPATSDGLLVTGAGEAPAPGERVRVHGRVVERDAGNGATITALEANGIARRGRGRGPQVAASTITAIPADWERFEGMRLRIAAPLTLGGMPTRQGELVASFDGRLFGPTERAAPGLAAQRVAADNARRTLRLDDGRSEPERATPWYLPAGMPRTGSIVRDVSGVLDQRHGSYRLQLDAPLQPSAAQRPPPPRVAGDVRIASFNLENLFNGDGRGGGFPTPRGARTPAELQAQLAKLVATIQALDPDIAALMELENDGYGEGSSLAQLVAALGPDWRFVNTRKGPGNDEIRVGLIYRASRVVPVGNPAMLLAGTFGHGSRAPLAQAFRAGRGPVFNVVANHFKSKSCGDATGMDADQHDGQACWNALRTASAQQLAAWLRSDPTRSGSDLTLIAGDLNAYAQEDPIRALRAQGWVDALTSANVTDPYSYVYDSLSGRLDHALLSPALARHLADAAEWHVNADEPASSGYRAGGRGPWGSSDHDPLLLGFTLRD